MPNIEIKKLNDRHIDFVARLHITYLSTPFKGIPGYQLLRIYYQGIFLEKGAVGYIGFVDGRCSGFVCGIWDSASLNHWLITSNLLQVLYWTGLQIIISPSYILSIFSRLRSKGNSNSFELRPIVVDVQSRGVGLAGLLIDKLVEDANSRGFRKMHLYAEEDNFLARKLYSKKGFVEKALLDDRDRLVYEKEW